MNLKIGVVHVPNRAVMPVGLFTVLVYNAHDQVAGRTDNAFALHQTIKLKTFAMSALLPLLLRYTT